MNKSKITSGLILIIAGVFFLLMSLGLIDTNIIDVALNLWPVVLILVGVNIMLNKDWVKWVGIVLYVILVFGIYFYNPLLFSINQIGANFI